MIRFISILFLCCVLTHSDNQLFDELYFEINKQMNNQLFLETNLIKQKLPSISENEREKIMCQQCQAVLSKVYKIVDIDRLYNLVDSVFEKICQRVMDGQVCKGVQREYGKILFKNLLSKLISPVQFCSSVRLCKLIPVELKVLDYANQILKNNSDYQLQEQKVPQSDKKYKILHLTDTHSDDQYQEGTQAECDKPFCCRIEDGKGNAGHYGSISKCDLPLLTVEKSIQFIADHIKPDLIIWTGDSQNHDVWNQNKVDQTNIQRIITGYIKQYMPTTKVYAIYGNHECFPTDIYENQFSNKFLHLNNITNTEILKQQSTDMWSQYLDHKAQTELIELGHYSQYDSEFNINFIALNTQSCDNLNFNLFSNNTDPNNMLDWLYTTLLQSEEKGQKAILFGHIPPNDLFCSSQWAQRYSIVVERFQQTVILQLFGHTHNDHLSIQKQYHDHKPFHTYFVAPSLTTFDYRHPGLRVFEMQGYSVTDILQYRMDLQKYNDQYQKESKEQQLQFELQYSFKQLYGVQDFTVGSISDFITRMEYNTTLLELYIDNYHTGGPNKDKDIANIRSEKVQRTFICMARTSNYDDFLSCLGLINTDPQMWLFYTFERIQGHWMNYLKS